MDKSYHGTSATVENVKNLLKKAYPGDIIQYQNSFTTQHTAMIYDVTDNGITIYEWRNKDKGIMWEYYSWNDVVGTRGIGTFDTKINTNGISLYHYKNYNSLSLTNTTTTTPPLSITVYTTDAINITETNAVVYGSVSKQSGINITSCGTYFGTSPSNLTRLTTETVPAASNAMEGGTGFDMWYDLNKNGKTLTAVTSYYWQCYAIYNGVEYKGEIKSFISLPEPEPTPLPLFPPTITSVNANGSNVTVNWTVLTTPFVAQADYYDVYLVQSPWNWSDIKYSYQTTSTSHTFSNVADGDYSAFVIARPNPDSAQSKWVEVSVASAPVPPPTGNQTEQKTQYRYQTRTKNIETTTSDSPTLSGWTLVRSEEIVGSYGSWTDWQDVLGYTNDRTEVETRTVDIGTKTQIYLGRYYSSKNNKYSPTQNDSSYTFEGGWIDEGNVKFLGQVYSGGRTDGYQYIASEPSWYKKLLLFPSRSIWGTETNRIAGHKNTIQMP